GLFAVSIAQSLLDEGGYQIIPHDSTTSIFTNAISWLEKPIKDFPESVASARARGLLELIEEKHLDLQLDAFVIPGKPSLALLNYRNLNEAFLAVYPARPAEASNREARWTNNRTSL